MLQYRTIYPATLELLRALMLSEELQDFFLVGGTALALQLGHRISVDIDMFTLNDFNSDELIFKLSKHISISSISKSKNSLSLEVLDTSENDEAVKIDLIKYSYPLINTVAEIDSIRLLSIEDIIAMKLSAVTGRGAKKDFYDIFFLLKSHNLQVMIKYFKFKFPNTNVFQVLKNLVYFDDANLEPDPITIENIEWDTVKKTIQEHTALYISSAR